MADLENGLFSGANPQLNTNDPTGNRFLTALVKGEPGRWALRGGNAQSGGLSTYCNGARPRVAGYHPMRKEGAIILGVGGDNSNGAAGTFGEGAMTSGCPSDATENGVQANVTSVGYSSEVSGLAPVSRISSRATTACCTNDYLRRDDADTNVVISAVSSSSSATDKAEPPGSSARD